MVPWLPRGIALGETNWLPGRDNYDSRGGRDVIARTWGETNASTVTENVLFANFAFLVSYNKLATTKKRARYMSFTYISEAVLRSPWNFYYRNDNLVCFATGNCRRIAP